MTFPSYYILSNSCKPQFTGWQIGHTTLCASLLWHHTLLTRWHHNSNLPWVKHCFLTKKVPDTDWLFVRKLSQNNYGLLKCSVMVKNFTATLEHAENFHSQPSNMWKKITAHLCSHALLLTHIFEIDNSKSVPPPLCEPSKMLWPIPKFPKIFHSPPHFNLPLPPSHDCWQLRKILFNIVTS